MDSTAILAAVESVTKKWAKQRKSEERRAAAAFNRRDVLCRMRRLTLRDAAWSEMAKAYAKASSDGKYPANARQIMYAARDAIQEMTEKTLDDKYFTQTILPDYIAKHPNTTASWNVIFDARGHLHEPHTGTTVPLGTLEVREYLGTEVQIERERAVDWGATLYPTHGAGNRVSALLLIEKEGFMPLFESAKLAERFDIAILSGKGMSSVALRTIVESMCSTHCLTLFVLHDFDKSGFSIVGTLRRDTRRYSFHKSFKVVDLGLKLSDVEDYALDSEEVRIRNNHKTWQNLRANGATQEEIEFLIKGQRVEINALTSEQLIELIERKLVQHGVKKVIPANEVLADAYRRALEREYLAAEYEKLRAAAQRFAKSNPIPTNFSTLIKSAIDGDASIPWDAAVASIAKERFEEREGKNE